MTGLELQHPHADCSRCAHRLSWECVDCDRNRGGTSDRFELSAPVSARDGDQSPWAGSDAALDAWHEQRRELDARLTALLGLPAMRGGEPVSRIEVDEHGRLLAHLGRAGVVHARDAETLIRRATEVVEARRAAAEARRAAAREGET